jgi:hypothetical protein
MTDAKTEVSLTSERQREIGSLFDRLLRMHPEENARYSPLNNPSVAMVKLLKEEVDPDTDVSAEEIDAWRNNINDMVGTAFQ